MAEEEFEEVARAGALSKDDFEKAARASPKIKKPVPEPAPPKEFDEPVQKQGKAKQKKVSAEQRAFLDGFERGRLVGHLDVFAFLENTKKEGGK
jgi:hypothetical protein